MEELYVRTGPRSAVKICVADEAVFNQFQKSLVTWRPSFSVTSMDTVYVERKAVLTSRRGVETSGPGFRFWWDRVSSGFAELTGDIPAWQFAQPLRHLLSWIVDARGGVLLHAAGILRMGNRVALLTGPGGSGKSTLAVNLALRKHNSLLGDDYVPVWKDDGRWHAAPLYRSVKLEPRFAEKIGLPKSDIEHGKKRIHRMQTVNPGEYEVGAVFVPRVTQGGGFTFKKIEPMVALQAAAPSTIFQSAGATQSFARIADLVQSVPCYELSMSEETLGIACAAVEEKCV